MIKGLLDELPQVQRLALAYAPRYAQRTTLALLALDARLAAVLRHGREPVLAQMRFAWWRDLFAGDRAAWPRGDAVVHLLQEWRDPAALVSLVDGWEGLLAEALDRPVIDAFAAGRVQAINQLASEIGVAAPTADACGMCWALGDLAAHVEKSEERAAVLDAAEGLEACPRLPRPLRPIQVLAALARRSLRRGGTPLLDGPHAALLAMRVGITGR